MESDHGVGGGEVIDGCKLEVDKNVSPFGGG